MKTKNKNGMKLLPLIATLGLCSIASAEEKSQHQEEAKQSDFGDQKIYVGVLMGGNRTASSDGTISDSSTSPTIGITGGFRLSDKVGIGFLASRYGMTSTNTIFGGLPVGTNSNTTLLLGQVNYMLGGFHIGAEMGTSTNSWDGKFASLNNETSNTSAVYGPQCGFDYRLDKTITLGGELHYLFSTAKNISNDAQALAVLKLWI